MKVPASRAIARALLPILGLMPAVPGRALSVVSLVQVVVSENGAWVVRIEARAPNTNDQAATARWFEVDGEGNYRRVTTSELGNHDSPERAFLSNTGVLLTVGDVENDPGLALAAYSPDGKLLHAWRSEEMHPTDYQACLWQKFREMDRGVEWGDNFWIARHADAVRYYDSDQSFQIFDLLGGALFLDIRTGKLALSRNPGDGCPVAISPIPAERPNTKSPDGTSPSNNAE